MLLRRTSGQAGPGVASGVVVRSHEDDVGDLLSSHDVDAGLANAL